MVFKNRAKNIHDENIGAVTDQLWLGDWVMLMQLAKNINNDVFLDLVEDLRNNLDEKRRNNMEMENGNGNSYPNNPMYSTVHKQ